MLFTNTSSNNEKVLLKTHRVQFHIAKSSKHILEILISSVTVEMMQVIIDEEEVAKFQTIRPSDKSIKKK